MSAEELVRMSLAELIKAYAARHLSPVEVMETTLSHAQSVNSSINALFSFRAEEAIAGARLSEARWKSNAPLGLLDGVPMTVKDSVAIAGWPYLHGIRANRALPPSNYDSPPRAPGRHWPRVLVSSRSVPILPARFGCRRPIADLPL